MQTQYTVLGYRIDLYFHKYKLAIEVDKLGHNDRNIDHEVQRQQALERELNCAFIRINPDAIDLNIFIEINKIHWHINKLSKKQTKKQTKKPKTDNLWQRLLETEFLSNHSIKLKCLKWVVKKSTPHIIKNAYLL